MLGGSFIGKDPKDYTKAEIDELLQMYAEITSSTGALKLPSGTTFERPASPNEGYFRYNDDLSSIEVYSNGVWESPSASESVLATLIHSATEKTTLDDADEIGIWGRVSGALRKVTIATLKTVFATLNSPAFTGTPTAKNIAYKPTPVTITSWSYVGTTITLNVDSHTFVAGDYIEVSGLTATTYPANGVHLVTSVTSTTIVFTLSATPTGTAGVSSASVKGYTTINGKAGESVGVNQTWQNLTASRTIGTTYTNTTGKPKAIAVEFYMITGQGLQLTVNGQIIGRMSGNSSVNLYQTLFGIIPAGATYSVSYFVGSGSVYELWTELI